MPAERFPSLDGIRAVSILLVLFAHVSNSFPLSPANRMLTRNIGLLGVAVFFVISGFLITSLLLRERQRTGTISLRKFYLRRAFRILPVTCLYLGFITLANWVLHLNISFQYILTALFFLANLPAFHGSWFVNHFWSLSVEEQYYLFFPALLKRWTAYMPVIIVSLLGLIMVLKTLMYLTPEGTFLRGLFSVIVQMDGVLVGSLAGMCYFFSVPLRQFIGAHARWLSTAAALLFILTNIFGGSPVVDLIGYLSIALMILCAVSVNKGWMYWILNTRLMTMWGRLSFSMYVWQQFFTAAGRFGRITHPPYNLVLIGLVSFLSWRFFESYFLRIKERWSVKGRATSIPEHTAR